MENSMTPSIPRKRGRPRKEIAYDINGFPKEPTSTSISIRLPLQQHLFIQSLLKPTNSSESEFLKDVLHIIEHYTKHDPTLLRHFMQPVMSNKYFKDLIFYVEGK
jgi:hypothetical protein